MFRKEGKEFAAAAEAVRRTGDGTLDVCPIKGVVPAARLPDNFITLEQVWEDEDPPDYASAGIKIEQAMMILNESLPNRQLARSQAAYRLLHAGFIELSLFLHLKGLQL